MSLEEQREGIERGGEFVLEATLRKAGRELKRAHDEVRLLGSRLEGTEDVPGIERIFWELDQMTSIIDSIETDKEKILEDIKSLLEKRHLEHFKKSIN